MKPALKRAVSVFRIQTRDNEPAADEAEEKAKKRLRFRFSRLTAGSAPVTHVQASSIGGESLVDNTHAEHDGFLKSPSTEEEPAAAAAAASVKIDDQASSLPPVPLPPRSKLNYFSGAQNARVGTFEAVTAGGDVLRSTQFVFNGPIISFGMGVYSTASRTQEASTASLNYSQGRLLMITEPLSADDLRAPPSSLPLLRRLKLRRALRIINALTYSTRSTASFERTPFEFTLIIAPCYSVLNPHSAPNAVLPTPRRPHHPRLRRRQSFDTTCRRHGFSHKSKGSGKSKLPLADMQIRLRPSYRPRVDVDFVDDRRLYPALAAIHLSALYRQRLKHLLPRPFAYESSTFAQHIVHELRRLLGATPSPTPTHFCSVSLFALLEAVVPPRRARKWERKTIRDKRWAVLAKMPYALTPASVKLTRNSCKPQPPEYLNEGDLWRFSTGFSASDGIRNGWEGSPTLSDIKSVDRNHTPVPFANTHTHPLSVPSNLRASRCSCAASRGSKVWKENKSVGGCAVVGGSPGEEVSERCWVGTPDQFALSSPSIWRDPKS
ncbi:hypothetical protein NMY22_g548 [Coprinellus aureogranulatus]|nr:hypothetical protein NMY22_g548 [Coprinellus aureogranulatus]